ncbi:hypothetical protein EXN66_Car013140 [Channa argus]|uniref:Uncharacterized protein n=1 Tax=Channa argus TaxID=215402 RepID=A0A6G1Q4A9_CHAAH|nr:hypothetical protein EXN66_Car013140 [Channa argus]
MYVLGERLLSADLCWPQPDTVGDTAHLLSQNTLHIAEKSLLFCVFVLWLVINFGIK